MYSEENFPHNNTIILTICSIIYIISIFLWQISLVQLLTFVVFILIIHRLDFKIYKQMVFFTIFILVIHTICGKLRIFVLLMLVIDGLTIYITNINKKDFLHFLSAIIPTINMLYHLLFLYHLLKYSWIELKQCYYLSKEFNKYCFYSHLYTNIKLSIKNGKQQAKEMDIVYRRLYYGSKKGGV